LFKGSAYRVNAKSVDLLNKCSSQDACTENEEDA